VFTKLIQCAVVWWRRSWSSDWSAEWINVRSVVAHGLRTSCKYNMFSHARWRWTLYV